MRLVDYPKKAYEELRTRRPFDYTFLNLNAKNLPQ